MAQPIKVDSHAHVYATSEAGIAAKEGYQIWEYGEKSGISFSRSSGTVPELAAAMETAAIDKAVVVNLFLTREIREEAIAALPPGLGKSERQKAIRGIDNELLPERLKAFNRWGSDAVRDYPQMVLFAAADAAVLSGDAGAEHVRDMVENHGARGVKLHCVAQGFNMSDERMWATYRACEELGVAIVSHSGPDHDGAGFAEPRSFAGMLAAFPRLKTVVAHMGGGTWQQCREIAQAYPNAFFDCCEIIEWTDSPKGPSERELAQLIKDIGTERVMMGSDFPWYDLDHQLERIDDLPLLSEEEKEGIIGRNAVSILGL